MDAFEFNKIAGAVLTALLVLFGTGFVTDIIFDGHAPEKPGYVIATADGGGHAAKEAASGESAGEQAPKDLSFLETGDAASGEKVAKKCKVCHTFGQGEENKVGPNLHAIVGRDIASTDGFKYSDALSGKDGSWTPEQLNCFLTKPGSCVPGTSMAFPGLKKDKDRADIIAYLKSLGG